MPVDLQRTFSITKEQTEDSEDWTHYLTQGGGKLTWQDLHEKPVTVIVGEAGIGKTCEFKNEVKRLQDDGKAAFFIELSQLIDRESWGLALEQSEPAYSRWQASSEDGYFFLDAVDEARLTSHAAFKKALTVVLAGLRQHLSRVRITISSRWTDWSIDEVRTAVEELVVTPIEASRRTAKAVPEGEFSEEAPALHIEQPSSDAHEEALVVSLDPLSRPEAHRLSEVWGVDGTTAFWAAIDDGEYDHMATRPLDLRWMVDLWNQKHSLGTYLELIEGNVANRLKETNPSYQACGAVLSLDRLRRGAEELAAAAEFSGLTFIATVSASTHRLDEVTPTVVLADWHPTEITRLLASAVFDEATFGRVKFHHRSSREYLSACWINRQLSSGMPFHQALPLFAASPFGETVLLPARRWTLCWLAAINVGVREWVTRHFPEMLVFDGDPEAWDALSVDQAFLGYVQRLKSGLRKDWYNNTSEFRRIGRCLPAGRIAGLLADAQLNVRVKTDLLRIVKFAHLTDCNDIVFADFSSPTSSEDERLYLLGVLEAIATPEQRDVIKADLLSGELASNELIAAALRAIDWAGLTVEELIKVFNAASSEEDYGSGPMARALKEDILPSATLDSATLLLGAIVAALPRPTEGKRFARHPETDRPERAWLFGVLPVCLERLLMLQPVSTENYPAVFLDAAEYIDALRFTEFNEREEFNRLHDLVSKHPKLRWQLGLMIGQSEDLVHSTSRLTWGGGCIVSFEDADLPELIERANDTDSNPDERAVWFDIAKDVAFRSLRSPVRKTVLATLEAGPESEARTKYIAEQRSRFIKATQDQRRWKSGERLRKRGQLETHEANKATFYADIQNIRDASHRGRLDWLVHYSYNHSGRKSLTQVDYEVIANAFGQDIASAMAAGLKEVWASSDAHNPEDYANGSIPWKTLTALAGLHTLLAEGLDIAELEGEEINRAARLAVWELNSPPSWFERMAVAHGSVVCEALHPWICNEALSTTDTHHTRGALGMALRCPTTVRSMLLRPLVEMVTDGRITRSRTVRAVVEALREDELISSSAIAELCRASLVKSIGSDGMIGEMNWLRTWLEEDPNGAWAWFEAHVLALDDTAGMQVTKFAKAMVDCNWVKTPADTTTIGVLQMLYALLTRHISTIARPAEDGEDGEDGGEARLFGHPIKRLREAIPRLLIQATGAAAHRALAQLTAAESAPEMKSWLGQCVQEHAQMEVMQAARVEPSDLRAIGLPFVTEPGSESQLFQQVISRLEEIRRGVEEGPFSDRDLFARGMPEKHLQHWLAARLRDTPNRRFSVHREEEVDDDKATDIQLSCPHGNVCIEIKPVDKTRYSANSLTTTLQTQIVDQYLKGYNSSHGILVLFILDSKTWDIPGTGRGQSSSALVAHLQEQAQIIKAASPNVQKLVVFPIVCVEPTTK